MQVDAAEGSFEPQQRSASADLYRKFTANANGSWLASLAAPRSLEDLALATSLGLQRTAVVAPALPESSAVADSSRSTKPHSVRAGSSAAARAAAHMSDGALLSLLLTASSGETRGGLAPSASRVEPQHSAVDAPRPAVSALDVSPASLLYEARSYLVAHPAAAFGPARTRAEAVARAAAAAADAAARPDESNDRGVEGADAEASIAASPAPAAIAAHPAVAAAFAPEFDRIYTRIALGLAPLAVSAALALDPGQSIIGHEGSAASSSAAAAAGSSVPVVSADVAAVRAQLVQHAAKRLARLPDAVDAADAAAAAGSTSGSASSSSGGGGGGAGASLAVAEAVLTALQDMLTDAGVVALVREAAAARLRL